MPTPTPPTDTRAYQLRIMLRDVAPPIWRVVQVAGDATLYKVHLIIQTALGWDNYHLFMFTIDGAEYGEPDPDDFRPIKSARRTKLFQVIRQARQRFLYEYDLGDGWEHDVKVEKVLALAPGTRYPVCLGGERACPPEDCGGPWGYEELLNTIRNPEHDVEIGERKGQVTVGYGKGGKQRTAPLNVDARKAVSTWLVVRTPGVRGCFRAKRASH